MTNMLDDSKILSVDSLINNFCEKTTDDQWGLLKSGTPDAASKIQIAQLVLTMIRVLTTNVLTAMETMKIHKSEEDVVDSVNEIIADISSKTLSFNDQMDSGQSKCLTTLINREVTESITSSLRDSSGTPSSFLDLKQQVVNPYRLNAMVTHASNMFKNMKARTKALFLRPRLRCKSDHPKIKEEKGAKSESKKLVSTESRGSKMSEILNDEIRNMASGMVTPLIGDLPQKEVEDLMCDIGEEAEILSEDIGTIPSTSKRLCRNIKAKIKAFFTTCITKVWRCCMLEQLKKKYKAESHRASSPLVESLVENISSQLQLCIKDEQKSKNLYFTVAFDDVNTFVEDLYCMINRYFTADKVRAKVRQLGVATRRNLCSNFQKEVWIFVGLVNWWLTTQVDNLSEKVTLNDMQQVLDDKIDPQEDEDKESDLTKVTREMVGDLVNKILGRINKKTHLHSEKRQHLHNHLVELICSEMEKEDLCFPLQQPHLLKSLSDRIYKDLCKKWGGVNNVVSLLILDHHVVDTSFISVFKHYLSRPPKILKIFSFFINCRWRGV